MMIKKTLTLLLLSLPLINYAQKVDIDKEYARIEYIQLPSDPILDTSKRKFSITSNKEKVEREIKLYGFEKVEKGGDVSVDVFFDNTVLENTEVNVEKHQDKNKEGKVTRTWYTHQAIINYLNSGKVTYKSPNSKDTHSYSIGGRKTVKKTFNSGKAAQDFINANQYAQIDSHKNEFINNEISSISDTMNKKFGYEDWWHNEMFWILDSKKNPDYADQKKALEDIKNLFSKIKRDSDVQAFEPDVKKLEEYFLSIIPKYPKSKRKHRKMKFASYYNIAKLYLSIEKHEKVKEYAQKIIDNDYDKKEGTKLIDSTNVLINSFRRNKTKTRHLKIVTKG